ncbi:MAG: hypothetical protein U0P30_04870 [Vicinamibacterales bacterium]
MRVIRYAPNLRLDQRLRPDDDTVVVESPGKGEEVVYLRKPTEREIALELLNSTAAVVVRVSAAESELIDEGRWIATRVSATVAEVLRVPAGQSAAYRVGQQIAVTAGGGRLQIGGVQIETEGCATIVPGRRYVFFIGRQDVFTALPLLVHAPLLLNADGSLSPAGASTSPLVGASLRRLRQLARSGL